MGLDLSPYFWGLVFPNLGSKAYVGIVLELWTYRKPPVSHFKVCQTHFETSKTFKKNFYGVEKNQKLNTILYATNMTTVV